MDISLILTKNYQGSEWALDGEDYAGLNWLSETPKPTKAALEKQWAQVQYDLQVEAVNAQRLTAYQTESDPIFFEYQRGENTEEAWKAKITEIQARYPFPTAPEAK
jgi:hypothetical protein